MKALSRVASLSVAALVLMISVPAWAHTEFEYSEPSADAEVAEAVSEIVVAFTLPVTPVGNGFDVLDPEGEIHQPTVETNDNTVFRLLMTEPLAGGVVGVRYEVTAEDGHVLAGGFSFTVATAAATTTLPPATTAVSSVTTTIATTSTVLETTTTTGGQPESGSMAPWLLGGGLVAVATFGLIAGLNTRSSR